MTIDEAIVRERRLTAGYRNDIQILKNFGADILSITSVTKQMEYHEQLAEWLEELKEYKEHEFDILKKDGELLYKHGILDGYNKAIDDFSDKIISLCDDVEFMNRFNEFTATTILEIAEQLKAGVEDGNNE